MLMSGEITLPGTLMKMTNWLVMTRHAASAGRGMCHQPTQARAEQRTNWIASNIQHSSGVVNCTNCPVQPTSLIMNTYTCRNKTHVIALYASLSFEKYLASDMGRYLHGHFLWNVLKRMWLQHSKCCETKSCLHLCNTIFMLCDWLRSAGSYFVSARWLLRCVTIPTPAPSTGRPPEKTTLAKSSQYVGNVLLKAGYCIGWVKVPLESRPNFLRAIYGCLNTGLLLKAHSNNGGVRNMITPWRIFIFC